MQTVICVSVVMIAWPIMFFLVLFCATLMLVDCHLLVHQSLFATEDNRKLVVQCNTAVHGVCACCCSFVVASIFVV